MLALLRRGSRALRALCSHGARRYACSRLERDGGVRRTRKSARAERKEACARFPSTFLRCGAAGDPPHFREPRTPCATGAPGANDLQFKDETAHGPFAGESRQRAVCSALSHRRGAQSSEDAGSRRAALTGLPPRPAKAWERPARVATLLEDGKQRLLSRYVVNRLV